MIEQVLAQPQRRREQSAAPEVALGDRHDEPEVRLGQLLLGLIERVRLTGVSALAAARHAVTLVVLLAGLAAAAVWITQLRRTVTQRTAQLRREIDERQQIEQRRAVEQERALAGMPESLARLPRDEIPLLPFDLVGLPALYWANRSTDG